MQLRKTPKKELKIAKLKIENSLSPVVNEEKTGNPATAGQGWKNIFGVFSQFVAIGGDFV